PERSCPMGLACQQGFCNSPELPAGSCCGAPPDGELFVDVRNTDFANGSANCPLPTITAAADLVKSAGARDTLVHVAPGLYDAQHGERFPIELRQGTSLDGADAAGTVIEGEGVKKLDGGLFGSGGADYFAALLVGDDEWTTRISHLTIRIPRP